jgi:hypothetical protein
MLRIFVPRRSETATETINLMTAGDDSARGVDIAFDD